MPCRHQKKNRHGNLEVEMTILRHHPVFCSPYKAAVRLCHALCCAAGFHFPARISYCRDDDVPSLNGTVLFLAYLNLSCCGFLKPCFVFNGNKRSKTGSVNGKKRSDLSLTILCAIFNVVA